MYSWQTQTLKIFDAYASEGRVPHALLITGPSGCGKLDLAGHITRELLCLESAPGGCGRCRSCSLLDSGAHPDYRNVTFQLNENTGKIRDVIRVSQIRALIEALYKTTTISPRKAAVIHPAERMNISAANALLKTLEEPVGDTVLILVAHDAGRLPATVRSRCQRLSVALPGREEAVKWLIESGVADSSSANEALAAAAGRPLEARALLEEGTLDQYRSTLQTLHALRRGEASDGRAMAVMADFDPVALWNWLSLRCAGLLRASLVDDPGRGDVRTLADLQRLADRNRLLAGTPVRKDLLLRDWLIQWKNLPASLPLDPSTQEA